MGDIANACQLLLASWFPISRNASAHYYCPMLLPNESLMPDTRLGSSVPRNVSSGAHIGGTSQDFGGRTPPQSGVQRVVEPALPASGQRSH